MGVLPLVVDAYASERARHQARARVRAQGPTAGGCGDCRGPCGARHPRVRARAGIPRVQHGPPALGPDRDRVQVRTAAARRLAHRAPAGVVRSGPVRGLRERRRVAGEPCAGSRARDVAAPGDRRRPRPARAAAADRDPRHRRCRRRGGAGRCAARHRGAARHPVPVRHDCAADVHAGSARPRREPRSRDSERDPGRARPGLSDNPRRPCWSAQVFRPGRAGKAPAAGALDAGRDPGGALARAADRLDLRLPDVHPRAAEWPRVPDDADRQGHDRCRPGTLPGRGGGALLRGHSGTGACAAWRALGLADLEHAALLVSICLGHPRR